jgi:hypothetical protein
VVNCPDKKEKDSSGKTNGNKMGEFKGECFKCHEFGHKPSNCHNKGKNNEGSGHEDTMEVALVIIDVGKNGQIFGNNESESNGTGRDFGKEGANFGEISTFGNNAIPDDFFDDWSFFESEDDDETSQEVMADNEHPVKEGEYCKICYKSSKSLGHTWCLEGKKGTVKVLDDEADEDEDMGDDKEPIEMRWKTPKEKEEDALIKIKMKERLEDIIVNCKCLKLMKSNPEADWAMISNDAVGTEVALMVMKTTEGSDEGFVTAGEEEEESVDLSESLWGQCPECNGKGPLGLYCSRCEDTGLIYDGPCSPRGSSQEDKESCNLFEWEFNENKEIWDIFFPMCGLSEEQIERIMTTLLEQALEVGVLYDIEEIITDL